VTEIPAELKEAAKAALSELIDAVSNKDDVIAEMVIENKPITPQELKPAIRRLTCKIELIPVLCGSAFKKRGVQPLVDAVVDYLPSPLDIPPAVGIGLEPDATRRSCVQRQLTVLLPRVQTVDRPLRRQAGLFRVYSGQLKKGDVIYNPRNAQA
jgi:elongation factor G